ncbi:hypothetical protein [Hyphococcus sp.]|uniref:hypothetical protein n=1 Tax=Hyphococcus sp. TaxID=2038636 RepID=UPI0020870D48|nr:MAG: hypothetical protein DHS20C04_00960 [Marinicaulis sp.]
MSEIATFSEPTVRASQAASREGWLFSPTIDFLGLGGGSLLALAAITLLTSPETHYAVFSITSLWLANIVNHPHFAHSYQIFYRNFKNKLTHKDYPAALRARYVFSGIIAPISLAVFFAASFAFSSPKALGYGASIMFFMVGWHYVKQGYGMAMVDAVLKKRFFNNREKNALLLNAYATWIFAWMFVNRIISEHNFFGLDIPVFNAPDFLLYPAAAAAIASAGWTVCLLGHGALNQGRRYPVNGLLAYGVSLYPWLLFGKINPVYFTLVPLFHSLQYMTVVWRYELNTNESETKRNPLVHLAQFYGFAVLLGAVAFWGAPILLADMFSFDNSPFTGYSVLAAFWAFINVHHYLMDNVMWRKGNPDVAQNLFGMKPTK